MKKGAVKKAGVKKPKLTEEKLKSFLTAMTDMIGKKHVELFTRLRGDADCEIKDAEGFWFKLVYPFQCFIDGLVQTEIGAKNRDEIVFLLTHHSFVDGSFQKLFSSREGGACSADKSRAVTERLLKWFRDGKRIEWDRKAEYTYHQPKTIFTSHDEIVGFFNALHSFYHGNPTKYLDCLKTMLDSEKMDADTYTIIRRGREKTHPENNKIIATGKSLEEARKVCQATYKNYEKEGWCDDYYKEEKC